MVNLKRQLEEVQRQWHNDEISLAEFTDRSEKILDAMDQQKTKKGGVKMGKLKMFVIGGAVVIGLGACTAAISGGPEVKKESEKESAVPILQPAEPKEEPKKEERKSSAPKNDGITQETFDLIIEGNVMNGEGGTSLDAVQGMISSDPLTKVSANVMGVETVTYSWLHFESGSSITVSFVNGKAVSKVFSTN